MKKITEEQRKQFASRCRNWNSSKGSPMKKRRKIKFNAVYSSKEVKIEDIPVDVFAKKNKLASFSTNIHVYTLTEMTLDQADHVLHFHKDYPKRFQRFKEHQRIDGKTVCHNGKEFLIDLGVKSDKYPYDNLKLYLDYPLHSLVEVTIKEIRVGKDKLKRFDPKYIAWIVAQEYLRIYKNWKKYQPWGHELNDLWIELVSIYKNGYVSVFIGS